MGRVVGSRGFYVGGVQALEQLRRGISHGKRVDLSPWTRQYLNNGSALIGEVGSSARFQRLRPSAPITCVRPSSPAHSHIVSSYTC
eukprot:1593986-Amphidinium_carterae.2